MVAVTIEPDEEETRTKIYLHTENFRADNGEHQSEINQNKKYIKRRN